MPFPRDEKAMYASQRRWRMKTRNLSLVASGATVLACWVLPEKVGIAISSVVLACLLVAMATEAWFYLLLTRATK